MKQSSAVRGEGEGREEGRKQKALKQAACKVVQSSSEHHCGAITCLVFVRERRRFGAILRIESGGTVCTSIPVVCPAAIFRATTGLPGHHSRIKLQA